MERARPRGATEAFGGLADGEVPGVADEAQQGQLLVADGFEGALTTHVVTGTLPVTTAVVNMRLRLPMR